MKPLTRLFVVLTLGVMLSSSFYVNVNPVKAQAPSLADTINIVVNNIQNWASPWTVLYGQIFGLQNQTVYNVAITQAYVQNDSLSVFFIARLAEINGFSSTTINNTLIATLNNGIPSFTLYDRYMPYAYQWAKELGVSGWNISTLTVPDPSGRYYDEYAESISMLLQLDKLGVNTTSQMAAFWQSTQKVWDLPVVTETGTQLTPGYYQYADSDPDVECEMGNFAVTITEYQNQVGEIPYYANVLTDLQTKLLVKGFNSPAWGTIGVIKHATSNPQLRLGETLGVLTALQMLYPYLSIDISGFSGILNSWNGLVSSGLYNNGRFSTNTIYGDTVPSDDASSIGAMTLFLEGIIPQTGYLAITANNEAYQDYRTCFPTSEWSFNYTTHSIQIPVVAGNLGFDFGSNIVTQNFSSNGVYNVHFSSDWNSIALATKVANLTSTNFMIQPPPTFDPTTAPSSSPTSTTPAPTSESNHEPSVPPVEILPSPTPGFSSTPALTTPISHLPETKPKSTLLFPIFFVGIAVIISIALIQKRRKKHEPKRILSISIVAVFVISLYTRIRLKAKQHGFRDYCVIIHPKTPNKQSAGHTLNTCDWS